jgi:hypothetical protein
VTDEFEFWTMKAGPDGLTRISVRPSGRQRGRRESWVIASEEVGSGARYPEAMGSVSSGAGWLPTRMGQTLAVSGHSSRVPTCPVLPQTTPREALAADVGGYDTFCPYVMVG